MRARTLGLLARTDLRLIGRDRFLLGVIAFILGVAVVVRLVLPGITATLAARGFDLVPYHPLITSYVSIFVGSQLAGVVYGFTLLESKEDGTLKAVMASPLPLFAFLLWRTAAPVLFGCVVIPAMALIVGAGLPGPGTLAALTLVGAPSAAIWALFVAALAENKVHAFALLKIAGAVGPLLIVALLLPGPWPLLAGVVPPFWTLRAYAAAVEGDAWWPSLGIGALVSTLAIVALLRRFTRAVRR